MNIEDLLKLYKDYLEKKGLAEPSFAGFMRYLEREYWRNIERPEPKRKKQQ